MKSMFSLKTEWECSVPPDMTDGVYACELTAENALGKLGYWVGFLYMSSGVCHFNLYPVNDRLYFDSLPIRIKMSGTGNTCVFDSLQCRHRIVFDEAVQRLFLDEKGFNKLIYDLLQDRLIMEKRCRHDY